MISIRCYYLVSQILEKKSKKFISTIIFACDIYKKFIKDGLFQNVVETLKINDLQIGTRLNLSEMEFKSNQNLSKVVLFYQHSKNSALITIS